LALWLVRVRLVGLQDGLDCIDRPHDDRGRGLAARESHLGHEHDVFDPGEVLAQLSVGDLVGSEGALCSFPSLPFRHRVK
jgi:hypothetical protein